MTCDFFFTILSRNLFRSSSNLTILSHRSSNKRNVLAREFEFATASGFPKASSIARRIARIDLPFASVSRRFAFTTPLLKYLLRTYLAQVFASIQSKGLYIYIYIRGGRIIRLDENENKSGQTIEKSMEHGGGGGGGGPIDRSRETQETSKPIVCC